MALVERELNEGCRLKSVFMFLCFIFENGRISETGDVSRGMAVDCPNPAGLCLKRRVCSVEDRGWLFMREILGRIKMAADLL